MKMHLIRSLILLGGLLVVASFVKAQAPQSTKYQAVIRDASGGTLVNQSVGFEAVIHQGSATGNTVYQETVTLTTNSFGLITRNIGEANMSQFAAIPWDSGPFFLETRIDPNGGSNYSIQSTSQLRSVPYALLANRALQADSAQFAREAGYADSAEVSLFSDTAFYALQAGQAETALYADSSGHAVQSDYADSSGHALLADDAVHAIYADTANYAGLAENAGTAMFADSAWYSDTSGYAMQAGHAQTASQADSGHHAVYSDTAAYAVNNGYSDFGVFEYRRQSGQHGQQFFNGVWNNVALNLTSFISGNSMYRGHDTIVLQPGVYLLRSYVNLDNPDRYQSRIFNITNNTTELVSLPGDDATGDPQSMIEGVFAVQSTSTIRLQVFVRDTETQDGANSGEPEVYNRIVIQKIQ